MANKDVTQLVAMLGSDDDRMPALQEYLHEHLHGAEMANSRGHISNMMDEKQPRVVVFAGKQTWQCAVRCVIGILSTSDNC